MNTIKFSHYYEKMPDDAQLSSPVLLEVLTSHLDELSQGFIEYDTKIKNENKYYALPNSKLLVLLLKTSNSIFTTVRRWTPEKESYYRSIRGQQVKIEVIK
ncbi:MAG: hypothetical protein O8C58_03360 [Candidatus Methanoperedens sp.]|nr:hypothetical protein [Candidatus Methanoperedens sp.]